MCAQLSLDERDYAQFVAAIRSGELTAVEGV